VAEDLDRAGGRRRGSRWPARVENSQDSPTAAPWRGAAQGGEAGAAPAGELEGGGPGLGAAAALHAAMLPRGVTRGPGPPGLRVCWADPRSRMRADDREPPDAHDHQDRSGAEAGSGVAARAAEARRRGCSAAVWRRSRWCRRSVIVVHPLRRPRASGGRSCRSASARQLRGDAGAGGPATRTAWTRGAVSRDVKLGSCWVVERDGQAAGAVDERARTSGCAVDFDARRRASSSVRATARRSTLDGQGGGGPVAAADGHARAGGEQTGWWRSASRGFARA
jgi:hypothetical protein